MRDVRNELLAVLEKRKKILGWLARQKTAGTKQTPTAVLDDAIRVLTDVRESIQSQETYLNTLFEGTPRVKSQLGPNANKREEYVSSITQGITLFEETTKRAGDIIKWHMSYRDTLAGQLERARQFQMSRNMERRIAIDSLSDSFGSMSMGSSVNQYR
eukprot:c12331_g1_i1.p2 GENE.c12331_g1_i1~~c12331_g1_i1.p2  ORF type:complete len:158 (+),score=32.33 c12331_g1_i1:600-1073(+)